MDGTRCGVAGYAAARLLAVRAVPVLAHQGRVVPRIADDVGGDAGGCLRQMSDTGAACRED